MYRTNKRTCIQKALLLTILSTQLFLLIYSRSSIAATNFSMENHYSINISFTSRDHNYKNMIHLKMIINDLSKEFPTNGTVEYYITPTINDEFILSTMESFFSKDLIDYFRHHEENESIIFNYQGRMQQSLTSNVTYYSLFWIYNSTSRSDLLSSKRAFGSENNSFNILCTQKIPISFANWRESADIIYYFSPQIIESYVYSLSVEVQDRSNFNVRLYYDTNNGVLLSAKLSFDELSGSTRTSLFLDFSLQQSTVPLELQNNMWLFVTISLFIGLGCLICIFIRRLKSKKNIEETSDRIKNL